MTDVQPATCSLDTDRLEARLSAIAAIGAESLLSSETEGDRHLLRFRSSPENRRRLEEIAAAEAECCSFLDLDLTEDAGDLMLSVAAPEEGGPVAAELAAAFARDARGEEAASRKGALLGAGGVLLAVCCIALPALFGVAIGTALGGVLDGIAAILIVAAIAVVVHRRRISEGRRC
jgi:hypothetical protein